MNLFYQSQCDPSDPYGHLGPQVHKSYGWIFFRDSTKYRISSYQQACNWSKSKIEVGSRIKCLIVVISSTAVKKSNFNEVSKVSYFETYISVYLYMVTDIHGCVVSDYVYNVHCMYTYVHDIYVYMYMYILCVYRYVCICIYICICVYLPIYTYTYMYGTYTHISSLINTIC